MFKQQLSVFMLFILFISTLSTKAQSAFSKVIYDNKGITVNTVSSTYDKGYILSGYNIYPGVPGANQDFPFILKLDSSGNTSWNRSYNLVGSFYSIVSTIDTGYLAIGIVHVPNIGREMVCLKLDGNGDTLWAKTIYFPTGSNSIYKMSVIQTLDSGFAISGYYHHYASPNSTDIIFAIKLKPDGSLQWAQTLDAGLTYDRNSSDFIKQTADSGFLIGGFIGNWSLFGTAGLLIKLAPNGNMLWEKNYRSTLLSYQTSSTIDLLPTNNGYLMFMSVEGRPALLWLDLAGNILSYKSLNCIVGGMGDCYIDNGKLIRTKDGGLALSSHYSEIPQFTKLDSLGNVEWSKSLDFYPAGLFQTADTGYFFVGSGPFNGFRTAASTTSEQIAVIKMDKYGGGVGCSATQIISPYADSLISSITPISVSSFGSVSTLHITGISIPILQDTGCVYYIVHAEIDEYKSSMFKISPNPSTGIIHIKSSKFIRQSSVKIISILGEKMLEQEIANSFSFELNVDFPPGVYIIRILGDGLSYSEKIILSGN